MKFFPTFFGSFYSARQYRVVRNDEHGIGAVYALSLLVLEVAVMVAMFYTVQQHSSFMQAVITEQASPIIWISTLFFIDLAMRAVLLLALGIAGRLISVAAKPFLTYASALRVAAMAYTPVAIANLAFCFFTGLPLPAYYHFGLALVMLAAALVATRE